MSAEMVSNGWNISRDALTSEKDKVSLMLLASRELQGIEIGIGNSDVLSLTTSVGAHGDVTISTSSKAGVDAGAKGSSALLAVAAATVSDVEGHDDSVALLQQGDTLAELLDDAHVLMACVS